MKFVNRYILVTLSILLLGVAFFIIQRIRNPTCESPLILFIQSNHNQPEAITNRIISELGGLPKTDMDVYDVQKSVDTDHTSPIYPVNEWTIESSSVTNSRLNALFDDDPTYSHDFVIRVMYADGDTAMLQYISWSYGIVACPILVSMGSGPPGQLKIMP